MVPVNFFNIPESMSLINNYIAKATSNRITDFVSEGMARHYHVQV